MKTDEELFNFLEDLMKELEYSDEVEASAFADRIRLAANISSVGTEVIMALRHELNQLLNSTIHISQITKHKLMEAIDGINRELAR